MELSDIKDVVLICVSITTISVTIYAFNKWKTEHTAKIKFDCAYKVLKALYLVRDNFNSLRAPFIATWELPKDLNFSNIDERNEMEYVINGRLKPFQESLNQYNSLLPEVEVLFSKEVRNVCQEVNGTVRVYYFKVNEYLQLIDNTNNHEHLAEIKKDVFNTSKNDKLEEELKIIVDKVEKAIRKYIALK